MQLDASSLIDRPITLLGVWAHPDDETYLSATLMQRVVAAGGRVVVVCATRGELGGDATHEERERFGALREAELRSAMGELGVPEVIVLGLPDGGCDTVEPAAVVGPLQLLMSSLRPHLTVTFGPDGITNHPDHRAVHRWTTAGWLASPPGQRGRLLYATMTDGFVARHHAHYPELPLTLDGDPISVADQHPLLRVEPTPAELERKRAALAAHASQTGMLVSMLGPERFARWWNEECFRDPTREELTTQDPRSAPRLVSRTLASVRT